MKLLYLHTKNTEIGIGAPNKPQGEQRRMEAKLRARLGETLGVSENGKKLSSQNALLAFVFVEKGDEGVNLVSVSGDIVEARKLIGADDILLCAFGHLGNEPASPILAKSSVEFIAQLVRHSYQKVSVIPFGWDKSLQFVIPAHHYNASFRSFEPLSDNFDGIASHYYAYSSETCRDPVQMLIASNLADSGYIRGNIAELCAGAGNVSWCFLDDKRTGFKVLFDPSAKMRTFAEQMFHTLCPKGKFIFDDDYSGRQGKKWDEFIREDKGKTPLRHVSYYVSYDVDDSLHSVCPGVSFDTFVAFNAAGFLDLGHLLPMIRQRASKNAYLIWGEEYPLAQSTFYFDSGMVRKHNNIWATLARDEAFSSIDLPNSRIFRAAQDKLFSSLFENPRWLPYVDLHAYMVSVFGQPVKEITAKIDAKHSFKVNVFSL